MRRDAKRLARAAPTAVTTAGISSLHRRRRHDLTATTCPHARALVLIVSSPAVCSPSSALVQLLHSSRVIHGDGALMRVLKRLRRRFGCSVIHLFCLWLRCPHLAPGHSAAHCRCTAAHGRPAAAATAPAHCPAPRPLHNEDRQLSNKRWREFAGCLQLEQSINLHQRLSASKVLRLTTPIFDDLC